MEGTYDLIATKYLLTYLLTYRSRSTPVATYTIR